jgi:hypothetical protein
MKKIVAFVLGLIFAFATVTVAADKKLSAPTTGTSGPVVTDNSVKKAETNKTKKKTKKNVKPVTKKTEKTPSNAI